MRAADYVEETTTSIAGTLGDGAVTLTAQTNIPRFSTAFGTGATLIRYVIEDTVNHKMETGVGLVASNVLTRTKPQVTWDGTTWNDQAPSALQFGSTPTAGNIKVRMSATAEAIATAPARQTSLGSDPWTAYRYFETQNANGQEHVISANTEYYGLYKLEEAGRLTGAQFEVTTAVAGSLKWALYALGPNGLPAQKIVDFTTTSVNAAGIMTDTATGSWSPAGAPWLTPGWYAFAFISDVGAKIRCMNFGSRTPYAGPWGRHGYYGACYTISNPGSYSTGLPATPSLGSATLMNPYAGAGDRARIGLRVVQ